MKKNISLKAFVVFVAGFMILPLFSFAATGTNPTISTVPTSDITQTSAKLKGFYNAGSAGSISVRFDWGDTPLLGNSTAYQTFSGSGSFEQSITVQPGKTYFVRAMGVATGYTPIYGSTLSFTTSSYTLATIQTMPATSINQTSATLNGYFNDNGFAVETRFQYANNSAFIGSTYTSYVPQSDNYGTFNANVSSLQSNTTYYFRAIAKNSAGTAVATTALSFTTTGTTPPPTNCVINSFNANPNSVNPGSSSTLSWTTSNCTSVNLSPYTGNQSSLTTNDSVSTGSISNNTTYTLTAYGNSGSTTSTTTVTITNNGGGNNCTIDDFYASPNRIDEGEKTTLYWNTTDCNNVSISNGIGNVSNDGNEETPRLYSDRTYTITAYGNNGSDSETITVRVDEDNNNNNDRCEIDDFYASPSSITQGQSFRLYWETTDCDDVYISNGIGNRSRNGNVSINNLYVTTTYQITAYGDGGNDYDSVTVYVNGTNPNPYPIPVPPYIPPVIPIHTTTYISTTPGTTLVDLDITSAFENVGIGEQFDIDIDYENKSSSVTAKDATLTIILPKNLIFQRISRGEYNKNDHVIFVKLEDISPKEKGTLTLQVRVGRASSGELLVTAGTLNYTRGANKEEVIDVLTNKVTDNGSVLGAFALGGFSGTLISWLISILLIMIVYAIARQIRKEKRFV